MLRAIEYEVRKETCCPIPSVEWPAMKPLVENSRKGNGKDWDKGYLNLNEVSQPDYLNSGRPNANTAR